MIQSQLASGRRSDGPLDSMQAAKPKRPLEKLLKVGGLCLLLFLILWIRPWGLWPAEGTQAAAEQPQQEQLEELSHVVSTDPAADAGAKASANLTTTLNGLCECPELDRPAGFAEVRVRAEDGTLERTTTCTADGRFQLEWPRDQAARIEALAGAAGWPREPARALSDAELDGTEIKLSMDASQILQGHVLDEQTSEPAPELRIRLKHELLPQGLDLLSDAAGGFAHGDWVPANDWVTEVFDIDPLAGQQRLVLALPNPGDFALDRDWVLRVGLGPTYFLDVRNPEFDSSWKARLVQRSFQPDLAGRLEHRGGGAWTLATTAASKPDRFGPWHGIRTGERPWVRFGPEASIQEAVEGEWSVFQLNSPDDAWTAEIPVGRTTGIATKALVLSPSRIGQVQGRVAAADGEPVSGALVRLVSHAVDGSQAAPAAPMEIVRTRTNSNGFFELPPAPVGRYTLQVEKALRPRHQVALELNSGRQELETILLGSIRPSQSIRGRMSCQLGHPGDAALVNVAAADGGSLRRSVWVALESIPDGSQVGSFSIDAVLDGSFELRAVDLGGIHNWQPDRYLTQSSTDVVQFECSGFARAVPLRITARSKEDDAPLDSFSVTSAPGQPKLLQAPETQPRERWSSYPIDQALDIAITSPGKAPEFANEEDVVTGETGRDLESVLSDGWGALILLREAPTAQAPRLTGKQLELEVIQATPIESVELIAGNKSFLSDASGAVRVALKQRPETIELRHTSWRAIGLSRLEVRDSVAAALPQLVVWMRSDTSEP